MKKNKISIFNDSLESMGIRELKMEFAGEAETEYILENQESYISKKRLAFILAVVLFLVFGLLDYLLFTRLKGMLWFIRFAIVIPIFLITFALTYVDKVKPHIKKAVPFLAVLMPLAQLVSLKFIPFDAIASFNSGYIVLVIFAFIFMRSGFINGLIDMFVMLVMYILFVFFNDNIVSLDKIIGTILVVSVASIGSIYIYYAEYTDRRNYMVKKRSNSDDVILKTMDFPFEEAILFIDEEGICKYVSKQVENLVAHNRENIIDHSVSRIFSNKDKKRFEASVKRNHKDEGLLEDVFHVLNKKGVGIPLNLTITEHNDKSFGKGYIMILSDPDLEYSSAKLLSDTQKMLVKNKEAAQVLKEDVEELKKERENLESAVKLNEKEADSSDDKAPVIPTKDVISTEVEKSLDKQELPTEVEENSNKKGLVFKKNTKTSTLATLGKEEITIGETATTAKLDDGVNVAIDPKQARIKALELLKLSEEDISKIAEYEILKKKESEFSQTQNKTEDYEKLQKRIVELEKLEKKALDYDKLEKRVIELQKFERKSNELARKNQVLQKDVEEVRKENRQLKEVKDKVVNEASIDSIKLMGRMGSFASSSLSKNFRENINYISENQSIFEKSNAKTYIKLIKNRIYEGVYLSSAVAFKFDLFQHYLKNTKTNQDGIDVLKSMSNSISQLAKYFEGTKHIVEISCKDDVKIRMNEDSFKFIIQNLVINSLISAIQIGKDALIELTVREEKAKVIIEYKDNGKTFPSYYSEIIKLDKIDSNVLSVNGVEYYFAKELIKRECSGSVSLSNLGDANMFKMVFMK